MNELQDKIIEIKREKNVLILAHYYQISEIQQIADFVGDSLDLAQRAKMADCDIILFCGVHFMAETAKIINPSKKVILPDLNAGCSLADSCKPDDFRKFKENNPNHKVISYINCSAEIKALTDVVCTSSNALKIVNSFSKDQELIFAPDKNLGKYLEKESNRKIKIWDGACIVHQEFSAEKVNELKKTLNHVKVLAHPECGSFLLDVADFIGSTKSIINFAKIDDSDTYIIATENGILYNLQNEVPEKRFIQAPTVGTCIACQNCPYMKMNTLEKVYDCLVNESPQIELNDDLIKKAKKSIDKMFELS